MSRTALTSVAAALAAVLLASVAAWSYFSHTRTSPQPIRLAPPAKIDYQSTASAEASGFFADRVTVPKPAGVQKGWLMVAFIGTEDAPNVTPPSGWTPFGGIVVSTPEVEQVSQRAFWRVADLGEPSEYTFRFDRVKDSTAGISAYSGVEANNPIDSTAKNDGHTESFGTPRVNAPPANATYDTRRIVATTWAEISPFGNPLTFNGVNEHWDRQTNLISGGVAGNIQSAGATAPASVDGFQNTDWVIQNVVLNASP